MVFSIGVNEARELGVLGQDEHGLTLILPFSYESSKASPTNSMNNVEGSSGMNCHLPFGLLSSSGQFFFYMAFLVAVKTPTTAVAFPLVTLPHPFFPRALGYKDLCCLVLLLSLSLSSLQQRE